MKRSMEALIEHFELYTAGGFSPPSKVADGYQPAVSKQDPRSLLCPSFCKELLTRGHMLADITTIIGSLDVVFGEIDR
jgi:NADH-quinone oxidoreductase subunit D